MDRYTQMFSVQIWIYWQAKKLKKRKKKKKADNVHILCFPSKESLRHVFLFQNAFTQHCQTVTLTRKWLQANVSGCLST